MSNIVLKNVCKSYDKEHYAVQDFSLEIPDREFVIFVGPSGCGKSTTLRMIAGLEEITSGELWIDGQLCNYVEAKDRDLSMVFQNYALYPNMTVYENMAFSLKIRKQPKDEAAVRHAAARQPDGSCLRSRCGGADGACGGNRLPFEGLQMHADGVLEGMENLKARRGGSRHPAGTGQPGRQQRRPDGTDPGGKRIPEAVPEV